MKSQKNKKKEGITRLLEIAGTKRWLLLASMLLAVLTSITQFVPFVSVYHILSELAANAATPQLVDKKEVHLWAYRALWAFIAFAPLLFASIMLSHIAAFNILYELRMMLAQKLVRLPLGFFTRRASGDIKKVMSEDVERIELFVGHHIPDITSAIVFPLLLVAYMYIVDWRLALIITIVFAVALALMAKMMSGEKIRKLYAEYGQAVGRMNSSIVEYVRGIQVVKTFASSTKAYQQLNHDINSYRELSTQTSKAYAPTYLCFYILLSSVLLFIIPAAVYILIGSQSYSGYIPTILLFLIFGGGIFFPVIKLMWIGGYMKQNTVGVALIDEILDKEELQEPSNPQIPASSYIEFDNVSFAYNTTPILQHVSFCATPGSVTALVGPSGAGKTTIAMLAARFWDVTAGEIRIGGVPIKQIASSTLMDNVAFVFQDNMLFFDTIEENIRMGNKSATHEQVVHAASAAQCHEFIMQLPHGYQTLVGEGGTYLSGGEQQRLALARAILKDAPIVLLDEATAYADPENEGKILEAFSHLIKGKTVIVIAHRLSSITNADQILVIDQKGILEQGTHEQLLAKKGRYSRMWSSYAQARKWVLQPASALTT